jgi:hypothetical protein
LNLFGALGWVVLLVLGDGVVVRAQEGRGYAEVRGSFLHGVQGPNWQLVEHVRPTLETEITSFMKLVATVDAALAEGRGFSVQLERTLRSSALGPLLNAANCSWPVPANQVYRIDDVGDYLRVDRLYVDLYAGPVDIRVGRQAINWGSAQFLNPTDPFPEFLLAEPWRPRRGINAARRIARLGGRSDITAVLASNDALTETRASARLRLNLASVDVAFVGAWRGPGHNSLVGVDLRGTLGLGYWVEAAYLFGVDAHEEISVGLDYSFPIFQRATLFVQYYRNGAGSLHREAYPSDFAGGELPVPACSKPLPFALPAARDPFAPFTAARDYLIAGATLALTEDLRVSVSLLHNLDDTTGLVVPTVTYAALDWLDFAVSAQVPYRGIYGGGEFRPLPSAQTLAVPLPGGGVASADLSSLVPDAVVTVWTRASF